MRGRGHGRDGRGHGGRGGRGGRGRGSSRGRGGRGSRSQSQPREETTTTPKELNIETDVTSYFVGSVSADQHFEGQQQNRDRYAAAMAVLQKNGVDIAQNARIRALAAAWARHDYELADALLQNKDNFGLLEVLKAVTLLDSGRQIRVLEKKMKRLQTSAGKVKPTTIGKLKSDIDNLNKTKPLHGTASGAICKHIRSWVKRFTKDELEFYALHFPKDPWKKLADICHFHPKQDFPVLGWFLAYCYGGPAPEGSMVARCGDVTAENVNSLIKEFPIPYTHVKSHLTALTNESKARIASYEKKLDTVIWWYDELKCTEVDEVITRRVQSREEITLPNGKLLERLLAIKMYREGLAINSYGHNGQKPTKDLYSNTVRLPKPRTTRQTDETKAPFFKELLPLGQKKMDGISLSLESPIVVIGDASGSMQVAIRTSSIIAGLLTAICQAQLVFFNTKNVVPPYVPKNIEEVLNLAVEMQAGGGTTPAASLWPFYEKKEVVKTFIIVTDEEENGQCHRDNFHDMYQKYHDEVYPAKLVFVSFFHNQNSRGDMVPKLEANGHKPMRFIFDFARPDLTKLDKMFGMLASGTTSFDNEIAEVMSEIKSGRLAKVFEKMEL